MKFLQKPKPSTSAFSISELINRYKFHGGHTLTVDDRYFSWLNYEELLDLLEELNLPAQWTWDIIDELLHQYQMNYTWRSALSAQDPEFLELSKIDSFFEKETIESLLKKNGAMNNTGLFATVGLFKLKVMNGEFKEALTVISAVDSAALSTLSKSINAYLNFFYHLAFCLIMTQAFKECVNVLEGLVLFFNKYKQFCSKSFSNIDLYNMKL